MLLNTNLPHNFNEERIEITFCGKGKCKCPAIDMDLNRDKIINSVHEVPFQYSLFADPPPPVQNASGEPFPNNITPLLEEFKLFVEEVKAGTFDKYMK